LAVIETEHVTVYVPAETAETLKPRVERLEVLWKFLCKEAGYTPRRRLVLWVSDDVDYLNGYAMSTPRPLVSLLLAGGSAGPMSGLFIGDNKQRLELVAIHEFTHILNTELNYGIRGIMEQIFGRVTPSEVLSIAMAYMTIPAQNFEPTFWLEGMAQWAETTYSQPDSPWGGRGKDPLIHMVWRLDAAAGRIPDVGDWRLSYPHFPYLSRPYDYGLAYTRYLDGAYRNKATIWQLAMEQAKGWPFCFAEWPLNILGKSHRDLIEEARTALKKEQLAIIGQLKTVPLTQTKPLTPKDSAWGAPAWTTDGRLIVGGMRPYDRIRIVYIDNAGGIESTGVTSYDLAPVRRSPGGAFITSTLYLTGLKRTRSELVIIRPDGRVEEYGIRLMNPDLAEGLINGSDAVAAVQMKSDGTQELCIFKIENGKLVRDTVVPTEGEPYSPAFRPLDKIPVRPEFPPQLAWVETDEHGSRLVTADLYNLKERQVVYSVKGRITYPCWSADGNFIYFCSDVSGVSNGYRIYTNQTNPTPIPVTHTLGGVIACVPSQDGKEIAVLDYDSDGPFIARIPNDPNTWPKALPKIEIKWPAPVEETKSDTAGKCILRAGRRVQVADPEPPHREFNPVPEESANGKDLKAFPYNGISELEFQFWTPTMMATEAGGLGLQTMFSDPIQRNVFLLGAGVGDVWREPVAEFSYKYSGWARTDFTFKGYLIESTFGGLVKTASDNAFDYSEMVAGGDVTAAFDLSGFERVLTASATIGAARHTVIDCAAELYAGETLLPPLPFEGDEHFAEIKIAYNNTTSYPMSYNFEDGFDFSATYRHSGRGLGGDLDRNRATGALGYTWSIFPHAGHQLGIQTLGGWSDGMETLQGAFALGGWSFERAMIPRGYPGTLGSGPYMGGYSAAYRMPLWRPYWGASTTPLYVKQVVFETFFDAGKISSNEPFGDGQWFRSAGVQLSVDVEYWMLKFQPGIIIAKEFDGSEDWFFGFMLGGVF
jgi:hypothetical protein